MPGTIHSGQRKIFTGQFDIQKTKSLKRQTIDNALTWVSQAKNLNAKNRSKKIVN